MAGVVDEPKTIAAVRSGAMRGLSLGTGVTTDTDGNTIMKSHDEPRSAPSRGAAAATSTRSTAARYARGVLLARRRAANPRESPRAAPLA